MTASADTTSTGGRPTPPRPVRPLAFLAVLAGFALVAAVGGGMPHHDGTAPADVQVHVAPAVVDPTLAVLQDLAQWATYGGLVLMGTLLFARLVGDHRRIRPLVRAGAALCAGAALVELLLFGPIAVDRGVAAIGDGGLLVATLGTVPGRLLVAQAVAAVLLMWVGVRVLGAPGGAYGRENLALCLGLVLVVAVAARGHAGALAPAALLPGVAHAAGMAVWLGSLLAAAVLRVDRLPRGPQLLSRLAEWCLYVVVASGLVLAVQTVPSFGALLTTDYGHFLVLKLALVAVVLVAAAMARRAVHGHPGTARAAVLRSAVVLELSVGTGVLAVTAHLVSRAPPI